jgi:anthranilate synthase component I
MRHQPDLTQFLELAKHHRLVPVYRQLLGDTLTPVVAFRKIEAGDWSFLFESVIGGERLGRYSFVGSEPFLRFQAWDRRVRIDDLATGQVRDLRHDDPLKLLEETLAEYRTPVMPDLPRFCGGAVGYAGYDTVRYVERLDHSPLDDRKLPDLCFALYDRMVIFDHVNKTVAVVAHAHVDLERPERSYEEAGGRVDALVERLQSQDADLPLRDITRVGSVERTYQSNFAAGAYEQAVEKANEYIRAGDIFQVVLSQRYSAATTAQPFDIYRTLRVVNPSPFMFYLSLGAELRLVGSSPEIMVRVEGDKVTIRPLAGTRKRGQTEDEDRRLADELIADPKERAEHVMLVDLGRNDVGRVAKFGSVLVSDVMQIERYSHVMHLSSSVTGRLEPGQSSFDALRSCLPAGTLSGAPKIRAMQIIDELEPHRRGPYGGAVGYIDFSGNMDTCIALRTMVIQGQTVYVQAGAGIVADSVPATEREETENKAMGLLRALEIAETQLGGNQP